MVFGSPTHPIAYADKCASFSCWSLMIWHWSRGQLGRSWYPTAFPLSLSLRISKSMYTIHWHLGFVPAFCLHPQLPTPITRILLNHFKWDKEKLLEKYFDDNPEEFFKCAHVINPFNTATEAVRQRVSQMPKPTLQGLTPNPNSLYSISIFPLQTTRSQCEECEICFSHLPPDVSASSGGSIFDFPSIRADMT